jgi:hypothetical protein
LPLRFPRGQFGKPTTALRQLVDKARRRACFGNWPILPPLEDEVDDDLSLLERFKASRSRHGRDNAVLVAAADDGVP